MDPRLKICHTVDALFGDGTSEKLPKKLDMVFSKKTGRIKTVSSGGRLLCTLRIDGGLAITPYLAQLLMSRRFKENCVEVGSDAAPFVRQGRSVFCKHVVWCGKHVRISADTPVLFEGAVIAVGRALLSGGMIPDMDSGVAVKIRDSLKSPEVDKGS